MALAFVVVFTMLSGTAYAGWAPPVVTNAPPIQRVVFDSHNRPWATFAASSGTTVGPLEREYRRARTVAVPEIPGEEVERAIAMALGPGDRGEVLFAFHSAPHRFSGEGFGLAVSAWRPGGPLAAPQEVAGDAEFLSDDPAFSSSPSGAALLAWVPSRGRLRYVLFQSGRLIEAQTVDGKGYLLGAPVISAATTHFDVFAPVRVPPSPQHEQLPEVTGLASLRIEPATPAITQIGPWPASVATGVEQPTTATDGRGDVAIALEQPVGPNADQHVLWVTSRRAGGSFVPVHRIGLQFGLGAQLKMSAGGRYGLMWQPKSGSLLAVTGTAGQAPSAATAVAQGRPGVEQTDPSLEFTNRGTAVIDWFDRPTGTAGILHERVVASVSYRGRRFSRPRVISAPGNCRSSAASGLLTPDRHGGMLATWECEPRFTENEFAEYAHFTP